MNKGALTSSRVEVRLCDLQSSAGAFAGWVSSQLHGPISLTL